MENDRAIPDPADVSEDQYDENDPMEKYDDAVMAADDTGMLASERFITIAEIAEADPGNEPGLGDQAEEK